MKLEIYFPVKGFRDWFRVFSSLRGLGFRLLSSKAGALEEIREVDVWLWGLGRGLWQGSGLSRAPKGYVQVLVFFLNLPRQRD